MSPSPIRPGAYCLLLFLLWTSVALIAVPPAAAQEIVTDQTTTASTTLPELPEGAGRIIQRPNSGAEPQDSGDRGGSSQILLFVILVCGLTAIGLLVRREIRSNRGSGQR